MASGAPAYEIYDGGPKIRGDLRSKVVSITVDDRLDRAAVATIELFDEKAAVSGSGAFKVGNDLRIELGYVGATKVVFDGEVTGWKGTFPRRGPQTLTVIAMDRFHRLRRCRRVETFLLQKDSEIASKVALDSGLLCSADATPIKLEYVCQSNQTDADFILERAKLYGYEVFVDGKTLRFRNPRLDDAPAARLKWHFELKHLTTTISLLRQDDVKVTAWNMREKKRIVGVAKAGDELSLMGSTRSGNTVLSKMGAPTQVRPFFPSSGPDEVREWAKGLFRGRSQHFVTGSGMCTGDPAVRRGTIIAIEGIGDHLSGSYYVHDAVHTLLPRSGYTTTFRVVKTAVKKSKAPPPIQAPPIAPPQSPAASETVAKKVQQKHWVEVEVVPTNPRVDVVGMPYKLTLPDGTERTGTVPASKKIRVDGITQAGQVKVELTADKPTQSFPKAR